MTPKLRGMLTGAGVFLMAGIAWLVYTPQPATRSMEELRDAGILDGQRLVIECPERLTKQTIRRINARQPGLLRPGQSYGLVTRAARCFNPDAGNCLVPGSGVLRVADLEGEIIVPSLRKDLAGIDLDASVGADDGGETGDVDDALPVSSSCVLYTCPVFDDLVDAGLKANPYLGSCMGGLNRLALQAAPCMMPNGWNRGADGGWCEETECLDKTSPTGYRPCEAGDTCGEVDCKFQGALGLADGGPRWRGFNVGPRELATGTACVPTSCQVFAGDVPAEWL